MRSTERQRCSQLEASAEHPIAWKGSHLKAGPLGWFRLSGRLHRATSLRPVSTASRGPLATPASPTDEQERPTRESSGRDEVEPVEVVDYWEQQARRASADKNNQARAELTGCRS